MSTKNAENFMHRARTDESLKAKLKEIVAREWQPALAAIVQVGAEAGFAFTGEEYQAAIKDELERQHAAGKLSEEQLLKVAGATVSTAWLHPSEGTS